jgi:orotate phosphoribosyltransferase
MEAVKEEGGEVVGIGVIVDRSIEGVDFSIPFFSCHRVSIPIYKPEECPLCQQGIPLIRPGSK